MEGWYSFWLSLINNVFFWPYRLMADLASFSLQLDFLLTVAPYASSLLIFFTNADIFPMYLQLAFTFYTGCFIITLLVNLIKLIWDLLPFV